MSNLSAKSLISKMNKNKSAKKSKFGRRSSKIEDIINFTANRRKNSTLITGTNKFADFQRGLASNNKDQQNATDTNRSNSQRKQQNQSVPRPSYRSLSPSVSAALDHNTRLENLQKKYNKIIEQQEI